MDVVHAGRMGWNEGGNQTRGTDRNHKSLFVGIPGPDNYRFTLAGALPGERHSPRHRHNFEQVRYILRGRRSITPEKYVEEGHICYVAEGTYYGPQVAPAGSDSEYLLLQFGGASGSGYPSREQIDGAVAELKKTGVFERGIYKREATEGNPRKNQDSFEAIWEHINGRKMVYPAARYNDPIFINPENFGWRAVKGEPGVGRRLLGMFTERRLEMEMLRLEPGAKHTHGGDDVVRLMFVLSGAGDVGKDTYEKHTALRIGAGESQTFTARDASEILIYGMPPAT